MEEAIFPPSPTWFLPNIMATRVDGSVCYGSKNNIVILKSKQDNKIEMAIIQNAHSLRITAIAFSPLNCSESVQNTLVSSSEDGFVKVWKIDNLSATMGHKCHWEQKEELGKIVSLDWSIANPQYIVSAAENNSIVLWDILSNNTIKFSFQKLGATVISCCPYNEKLVAVGGKTGQIYIISLSGSGSIIYRLRGHDNKIHSLSWCPIPYNVFKVDEIFEEFLLASACQNKEVFIWRVGSDGKCETKFQIPTNAFCKRDSQHHGKMGNSFSYLALCWLEPNKIYSCSNFGELIYFDIKTYVSNKISKKTNSGQKSNKHSLNFFKVGHYFHTKGLFAIAGLPVKGEIILYKNIHIESELQFPIQFNKGMVTKKTEAQCETDVAWEVVLPESSSLLWTAGQDRKLIACNLYSSNVEMVFNYHTMNGFVYCAVVSPHDPNKISIGVGDGMIRLWNLTESQGNVQMYWQKIKDRVMSLAWHPTKDGFLAYGTSEGRVGLIDTKSNKLPSVFKPSHPHPIYNLSWGPKFPSERSKDLIFKTEFDLYCVGDNTLSLYNPTKLNDDSLNLSKIIPFPCKKQTDICWKPDYSLLAVGNGDGSICLIEPSEFKIVYTLLAYKKLIQSIAWHPMSTFIDSGISQFLGYFTSGSTDNDYEIRVFDCKNTTNEVKVELVASLKGHFGHIQSVSWSPHISGRLVSTSADCSVQIWDVITQTPLVNFIPVGTPIFAMWSPVDPDLIITGCKNDVLCVWRISSQTNVFHLSKTKSRKAKKDKINQLSMPKELIAGKVESEESLESSQTDIAVAEIKMVTKSSKESKMFPKVWKGDANDELKICYSLLKSEKKVNSDGNYSLFFLCNEDYFKESIKAEEESHRKANNWTEFCELALWNGNIKDLIKEKITSGQLNDFLVSLAPIISPRVWQEACLSYSKTLEEKKFYRKAASYLIVCHKIYEAIHLLVNASLYLEALCIARSRLPKSDPILKEIVKKYGEWLFKNGSFLKACQCYIYLDDYMEVAKICDRKNQAEYLSLAALAAKKCGSLNLESVEATNGVLKCFETNNFELARKICEDHNNLKHLSLFFVIYHTISQLDAEKFHLTKDILSYIKESFRTEGVTFPSSLPKLFHKHTFYRNRREVFIIVTQELAFAACWENTEEIITHIIKALSTCCRYIQNSAVEVHPLYQLCTWLSPEGFLSKHSFFTLQSSKFPSKIKSLRAFLCAAIVRHLADNRGNEDVLKYFDLLNYLKEDLLDADSYKYFQNLIEIEVCEKRLLKNRIKLSGGALANGNICDENSEKSPTTEDSSHYKSKSVETLENNFSKSDIEEKSTDEVQENIQKLEKSPIEGMDVANPTDDIHKNDESIDNSTTLENCNSLDVETERDLEEKVVKDFDLLKRLKSEIENFEKLRISSPNPVSVYFMLKKLLEGVYENKSAKILLKELDKKWQELN